LGTPPRCEPRIVRPATRRVNRLEVSIWVFWQN